MHQVTWIILTAVKHLQVGKIKLAQFLKGSKSKDIMPIAYEQGYGGLMWHDIPTITGFIEQLEALRLIYRKMLPGSAYEYSVFELTDAGKSALEEKKCIPLKTIKKETPITVGKSEQETLNLLHEGKSVSEIAKERNLVTSTIYAHIFRLIVNQHISGRDIISEEIIEKVNHAAKTIKGSASVKEIKELLPEVSYEEIRCVLADMRRENQDGRG